MNYEFLDCGSHRRLEQIGQKIFIRQAPQADFAKFDLPSWGHADFEYRSDGKQDRWIISSEDDKLPDFKYGSIKMEIRLSPNGQLGVYPEQMKNWDWLSELLSRQNNPLRILNGFAYTGSSTLVCAQALKGSEASEICHLDASRSAVNWARANRDKSGLPEDSIRFIIDDIIRFLEREVRRGRHYDGLIMDPPAFGRAPGGKTWNLKKDLPELIKLCSQVLSPDPLFFLLSCHDPEITKNDLSSYLASATRKSQDEIETLDLVLRSKSGHPLPNGIAARWCSSK